MKSGLIMILLLVPFSAAQLFINEVMYNPGQCSDTYCEWVELYNNGSGVNLSGCFFDGKALSGIVPENDYFLLLRQYGNFSYYFGEPTNYQVINLSLSNTGKKLFLNGTSYCNSSFDYSEFTSGDTEYANGNNYTLERRYNNKWTESIIPGGTPGRENSIFNYSTDYWPLVISEVMPNPFEGDNALKPNGEWIELYNSGNKELYLDGLVFSDENLSHRLVISSTNILDPEGLSLGPKQLVVIYRDGDPDFNLNNNEDNVQLYYRDEFIDEITYPRTVEGMSWSNEEGDWYLTKPTPGELNKVSEDCDWLLFLDLNRSIYRSQDFEFEITLSRFYGLPKNVAVTGEITDVNGIIKHRYVPWTDDYTNSEANKMYSPNLAPGIYQVTFRIENLSCQDGDLSDNVISRLFVINPEYLQFDSSLQIESLSLGSDQKIRWGDQFLVNLNIHRGNGSTAPVQLWAEKGGKKISTVTKLNLKESFQQYPLAVPLQLIPNCDGAIPDGTATLIVEGLGQRTEASFDISGLNDDVCEEVEVVKGSSSSSSRGSSTVLLREWPNTFISGVPTPIKIDIANGKDPHKFTVWSYLYKGSKCLSCGNSSQREKNAKSFVLKALEAQEVESMLTADLGVPEGTYNLKVRIQRNDQKTAKEFTENVTIKAAEVLVYQESVLTANTLTEIFPNKTISWQRISSNNSHFLVYQSNQGKSKELIPLFLVISFVLLTVVLFFRKA